jgi:NAD(P)-dependent dehydrogenase (short-subunit alcohol dehydrogenase family)
MQDMNGRVAVITGAASGIGRALSVALAEEGCDLALADIQDEGLAATQRLLEGKGRRVTTHVADVADRVRMESFVEEVVDAHGRVDIVVNNAGVSVGADLLDHSIEDFEWIVGINLWGVVYGTKFFLPHLLKSDDAYIVNLSSMFGLVGVPGQSSYCATKFAVRGFSEAVAAELVDSNVRVLSVHPGGIRTNIARAVRWSASHLARRERMIEFFDTKTMPADKAAERITRAMKAGRQRLLIGAEAFAADYVKRAVPELPPTVVAWARRRLLS